jgi:hypothetical protein
MMCPAIFQVSVWHLFGLVWFTVNSFKLRKWWFWKWLKSPPKEEHEEQHASSRVSVL